MGFWGEFKRFAMRGNVVDLAVGVVIGGAFGRIVTSLVNDLVMPVLGVLTGGMDFKDLAVTLKAPAVEGMKPVTLKYGSFLGTALDFLIIAFAIFVVIRVMNRMTGTKVASSDGPSA